MAGSAASIVLLQQASDEALMGVLCARNEPGLFELLVGRWRPRIQGLCFRMTGNLQDSEDAVQETFLRAWIRRHQFRGESRFSTWLWQIALNATTDLLRRSVRAASTQPVTEIPRTTECPVTHLECVEQHQRVRQSIHALPEELRVIVLLRHYEQLRFREIAEILDLPQGTVCSRLTEALSRLARALLDDAPDHTRVKTPNSGHTNPQGGPDE